MRVRYLWLVALAAMAGLTSCYPQFSGVEFRDFYARYSPQPGTTQIRTAPAITGNAAADAHIRALAERRGYRLRSVHTGAMATAAGVPLDPTAAQHLNALIASARGAGYYLGASYGYRSVDLQRTLFVRRLSGYSAATLASGAADGVIEAALRWVAPPGYSKHHTGFTVDLSAGGASGSFGSSAVSRWLSANNYEQAKRHGFIPSYPPGAGSQGPDPEPWEYVYVGTRAINCGRWLAPRNDATTFVVCYSDTAIARAYLALGGPDGVLGPLTVGEKPLHTGRYAQFRNGTIYWSAATGAHELLQPFLDEYRRIGGPEKVGFPAFSARTSSDRRWDYVDFRATRTYVKRSGGNVYTLLAPFFAKHEALGGIHGPLRWPTSQQQQSADGRSTFQDFATGRIYAVDGRTAEVHGAVFTLHEALGGGAGTLGYPVTDLGSLGDGRGKAQWFDDGMVFYSPTSGAHALYFGDLLSAYTTLGGVRSSLGYPVSEPVPLGSGGGSAVEFEHGQILFQPSTGAHAVTGPILDQFQAQGGAEGPLGFPTGDVQPGPTPGSVQQAFEGGTLTYDPAASATALAGDPEAAPAGVGP